MIIVSWPLQNGTSMSNQTRIRAHYWRNQAMLICEGGQSEISNLTTKSKCPPCMYSISSSKCKYDAGGIEMQLIWSLLQNTVLINMSQIVANWALFNFLLFSDGTLWLMKNNRKCKMWICLSWILGLCKIFNVKIETHTLGFGCNFFYFGHFSQKNHFWLKIFG